LLLSVGLFFGFYAYFLADFFCYSHFLRNFAAK